MSFRQIEIEALLNVNLNLFDAANMFGIAKGSNGINPEELQSVYTFVKNNKWQSFFFVFQAVFDDPTGYNFSTGLY